jgi:hypothetical protein
MAIILESELQSDLESLYQTAGVLLNEIEEKRGEDDFQPEQMLDHIRFKLEDMAGTLQKDIFNVRHIIMKMQAGNDGA